MSSNQTEETGFRTKSNQGFNLLRLLADSHATTFTPFIRTGFGVNANSWNGVGAMVLLLLWCCGDPHDRVMSGYFVLWIGALVVQKCKTLSLIRRGAKIHSQYGGDPWLAMKVPFVRKDKTARTLIEPMICFLAGLTMCGVSPALGALWMIGAISLPVRYGIDVAAMDARMQVMDDAEIEGQFYADRRQHRGQDW